MRLNKNVFQIYLSDAGSEPPPPLQEASRSIRRCFAGWDYELYDKERLRAFVAAEFEPGVLAAYDKLAPYSYKADLGRYCLVQKYGGWYADISIMMLAQIGDLPPDMEMAYFQDVSSAHDPGRLNYCCTPAVFYSRADNPILADAIALVVRNCAEEYYGPNPLCPTGPGVFGSVLARHGRRPGHWVGDLMPLTPFHPQKNLSYVAPDGKVMAQHKTTWFPQVQPAEIRSFGAEGTNNYIDMWHRKTIYNR